MIIYEVNLDVQGSIAEKYAAWLPGHIDRVLACPGFKDAEWLVVEGDGDVVRWSIRYRVSDRAALETYFKNHAPELRAEGLKLFGNRFTASRRILSPR